MSTELEVLKQRITELVAENVAIAELRKENAELRKENTDFRMKFANFEAERAEFKRRIAETLRMTEEERTRRDAENTKLRAGIVELKSENAELRDRVTKVEQRQVLNEPRGASHNSSNDNTPNDNTPNNNSSNFNSGAVLHEKSSQDKETDDFLNEEHKKIVSEDIRRRNKEKKLQRESANQDSISDTAYVSETVNNIEKTDMPSKSTFGEITNCTPSELSHETEVIEDIANSAVDSNTINDRSASEEIGKTVSLGYDRSALENSEEIGKTVSLGYDRVASESLEEIESKADYQDKSVVGPSIVTEFVQDLLEELLSSDDPLQTIKFSSLKTIVPGSISIKKLANSFCQANGARNRLITAKRAEITAWRLFSERFENKVLELTGISDEYLRVRTSGYMVNRVTCSADRISKLTNPQIEYIIEQVKSKTTTSPVNEISETMATTSAHDSDDNFSDASSDVTDYFKEEGTNESTEEVSKKSEVIAKAGDDDDVYFYSEDEEVKGANEEVPKVPDMVDDDSDCSHDNNSEKEMPDDSDDDGYNDYGGYNEYGERDRGYYYRDGRYERKSSPMMSPIISPVTA